MKTLSATVAKTIFGTILDDVKTDAVAIERHGKTVAVVITPEDYERFMALDERYWGERANAALAEGMLGVEQTASWIKDKVGA